MKVLLTGSKGQLGRSLANLKPSSVDLIEVSRENFDLLDLDHCEKEILKHKPDWIINCAAYTNVEQAEFSKEKALKVNMEAPKHFAKIISSYGGKLIHLSTISYLMVTKIFHIKLMKKGNQLILWLF